MKRFFLYYSIHSKTRCIKKLIICIIIFSLIIGSYGTEEETITPTTSINQIDESEPQTLTQYPLTMTSEEGGTVPTQGGTFDQVTILTITANANEGFVFIGWEGSESISPTIEISLG